MVELTAAKRELLPGEEDVAFYHTHGWFMTPRLFTDDHIDRLATVVEEHRRRVTTSDALPPEDIGELVPRPLLAAIAARARFHRRPGVPRVTRSPAAARFCPGRNVV